MSKELKVGLLTIGAVVILFFGSNFLKNSKLFSGQKEYYAVYDKVDGLYKSDMVMVSGYPIGKVTGIDLMKQDYGKVLVTLEIDEEIEIRSNSVAIMYSADLLGAKSIKLLMSSGNGVLESGDTINTEIKKELMDEFGDQIEPLTDKIDGMLGSLDTLVAGINFLFSPKNDDNLYALLGNMNKSVEDLNTITANLSYQMGSDQSEFNTILTNVESMTTNLEASNDNLTNIITNFSAISDTIAQADIGGVITETKIALNEVNVLLDAINNGDGSVSAMLNDPDMYNNLEAATENLNNLLDDVQSDPQKYVSFSLIERKKKCVDCPEEEKKKKKKDRKNNQ